MNIGTIILILFVILAIFKWLYDENIIFPRNEEIKVNVFSGKINEKLLTNNELDFFNKLKAITDEQNLLLFTKVRLADIFKTSDYSSFGKIKSKHIDFIICDNKTRPIKFIELDDSTHNKKSNFENDYKKNEIFKTMNIEIFRIKINEIDTKLIELKESLKI
jgi:hypothetical protein